MNIEEMKQQLKNNIVAGTGLIVGVNSKMCKTRKPRMDGEPKCSGCVSEEGCELFCQCMIIVSKGILCGDSPVFTMLDVLGRIQQKQDKIVNSPMAKKLNAMLQEER